jgi:hypothetical protein
LNDINRIISELERQRIAIERAISALRDVSAPAATTSQASASKATKKSGGPRKKRQLSEEGRQRIIEATKKRWAAKRAADAQKATAKSSAPGRKKRASKKSEA